MGLGLGVWQVLTVTVRSSFMTHNYVPLLAHQIHPDQNALFLEAWARALRNLNLTKVCQQFHDSYSKITIHFLQKVTDLDFSWVSPRPDEVPQLAKGSQAPGSNVTINFSKRSIVK